MSLRDDDKYDVNVCDGKHNICNLHIITCYKNRLVEYTVYGWSLGINAEKYCKINHTLSYMHITILIVCY